MTTQLHERPLTAAVAERMTPVAPRMTVDFSRACWTGRACC